MNYCSVNGKGDIYFSGMHLVFSATIRARQYKTIMMLCNFLLLMLQKGVPFAHVHLSIN